MKEKPKYTKDFIREKLISSDQWLHRGLLAIYDYQTAHEQAADRTVEDNGVGFSGVDSEFLSSVAKKLKTYGNLTPNQTIYVRKCMLKYAGQLARIANNKQ